MPRSRKVRRMVYLAAALALLVLLPLGLFALNGMVLAAGNAPVIRASSAAAPAAPREVTFLAYNIAKAFAHRGGLKFDPRDRVEVRLRAMADAIRAENPDVVFLSEAITECGPCDVDQVAYLARACGFPFVATGEDYNVGVPFYRVVGGNAVLSKFPLAAETNLDLAGRQPFWVTRNNRRALVVSADFGAGPVLLAALHNDSFDMRNNERQVRQLLDFVGDRPAVLAGDFNNRPHQSSIRAVCDSGKFCGEFDGPPTFFEGDRAERIDYILAPAAWTHLGSRVVETDTSDHRPLVSRFRLPG